MHKPFNAYSHSSFLMEPLLSEQYLRKVFGDIFWVSSSQKGTPMGSFALGLEQVIESQGAVISNATALLLNNAFSQGRHNSKQKYLNLFLESRLKHYCPSLLRESLRESLHQAFPLPPLSQVKMKSYYASSFFLQSQVLYRDQRRKEEFVQSHFQQKDRINNVYYFIPTFTVEGLV